MCSKVGLHVDFIVRSHDQKSHVASDFNHHDPMNAMVPLITLLALCDINIGVNEQNSYVAPHFDHLDQRNAMVPLTTL